MRIFNKACVAAAFGMILLVTFGCEGKRNSRYYDAYDECMISEIPYSPSMKDALCKEYALRIMYGWSK